jgi:ankyrin repeat protein
MGVGGKWWVGFLWGFAQPMPDTNMVERLVFKVVESYRKITNWTTIKRREQMRGQMGRLVDYFHGRIKGRSPEEELHVAAFEGDLNQIEELVKHQNIHVDTPLATIMGASIEKTPLFLAIQEGHLEAAKLLVKLGADPDRPNDINYSPLMGAASAGDLSLVNFLLQIGASPNYFRPKDGATALSFATHFDGGDAIISQIVASLIEAGADVEHPANDRQSVLMLAARGDLPLTIGVLLKAGANPERKCSLKWALNWTALDHAINEASCGATKALQPNTITPTIVKESSV